MKRINAQFLSILLLDRDWAIANEHIFGKSPFGVSKGYRAQERHCYVRIQKYKSINRQCGIVKAYKVTSVINVKPGNGGFIWFERIITNRQRNPVGIEFEL